MHARTLVSVGCMCTHGHLSLRSGWHAQILDYAEWTCTHGLSFPWSVCARTDFCRRGVVVHVHLSPWSTCTQGLLSPRSRYACTHTLVSAEWMCMHELFSPRSGCVCMDTCLCGVHMHAQSPTPRSGRACTRTCLHEVEMACTDTRLCRVDVHARTHLRGVVVHAQTLISAEWSCTHKLSTPKSSCSRTDSCFRGIIVHAQTLLSTAWICIHSDSSLRTSHAHTDTCLCGVVVHAWTLVSTGVVVHGRTLFSTECL